jgi:hypothetical protein
MLEAVVLGKSYNPNNRQNVFAGTDIQQAAATNAYVGGQTGIMIKKIISDPALKRELIIRVIMAMQEHEGRDADKEKATAAYDKLDTQKIKKMARDKNKH